ncbi:MAG: hypothetical protein QXM16_09145 [Nitrososphaerota archaeon]
MRERVGEFYCECGRVVTASRRIICPACARGECFQRVSYSDDEPVCDHECSILNSYGDPEDIGFCHANGLVIDMSNPEAGKGVVPPWNPPVRQAVADVFLIYGMLSRSMIGVNGSVAYTTEHPETEIYAHTAKQSINKNQSTT